MLPGKAFATGGGLEFLPGKETRRLACRGLDGGEAPDVGGGGGALAGRWTHALVPRDDGMVSSMTIA